MKTIKILFTKALFFVSGIIPAAFFRKYRLQLGATILLAGTVAAGCSSDKDNDAKKTERNDGDDGVINCYIGPPDTIKTGDSTSRVQGNTSAGNE